MSQKMCGAIKGWYCTLLFGHTGDHLATIGPYDPGDGQQTVMASWPQEPLPGAAPSPEPHDDYRAEIFADVVKGAMERGIDVPKIIAEELRKGERQRPHNDDDASLAPAQPFPIGEDRIAAASASERLQAILSSRSDTLSREALRLITTLRAQVATLTAQLAVEREKHDEEAYNDMAKAVETLTAQREEALETVKGWDYTKGKIDVALNEFASTEREAARAELAEMNRQAWHAMVRLVLEKLQARAAAAEAQRDTYQAERDEARKDCLYHAECRPNRKQAEAWRDDAKAMNDKWADEVKARRDAEEKLDTALQAQARFREALTRIRDGYAYECQCEHDTEDCCARMEDADICAFCSSAAALLHDPARS